MEKIKSFKDLQTWKEAHLLVLMIYANTKLFPKEETFGLTNQLRRAVVSISSNIAEGFGRKTEKEKKQFYHCALSSLHEVQNQILIAKDVKYLGVNNYSTLSEKTNTISRLLNGLMKTAVSK